MNKLMKDTFEQIENNMIEDDPADHWWGKVLLMISFFIMVFILCLVGK